MPNIWTGKLHKAQSIVGSLQIILNPIRAHISGSLIVLVTMLGVSVTSYQLTVEAFVSLCWRVQSQCKH